MADDWQDIPEGEGLTLGPEDALEREISRSKALKVERLQLRDRVEKLEAEVETLRAKNHPLKTGRDQGPVTSEEPSPGNSVPLPPSIPARWAFTLLAFNLAALGLLLYFLVNK